MRQNEVRNPCATLNLLNKAVSLCITMHIKRKPKAKLYRYEHRSKKTGGGCMKVLVCCSLVTVLSGPNITNKKSNDFSNDCILEAV